MGDAQALQLELGIDHDTLAEVGVEQPPVHRPEALQGQGGPGFLRLVRELFKLREHRLPEERSPEVIHLTVDQVGAHRAVLRLGEKMLCQEDLVEGRGHLGEENRVVVVLEALRPTRVPGVHRVTRLVGEGVDVGEDVRLVVHQDVGGRLIGAVGEGAAALPPVLVAVAPALLAQAALQHRGVLAAERGKRADHHAGRLVEGDITLHRRDQRGVGIVDMQVGEIEDLPAESIVAVKHRETAADRGDQAVVDADRHIVGEKSRFAGGGVVPGAGQKDIPLHRAGQRTGEGEFVGVELRVELLEGGLADPAVGSLEQGGEAALGQLHLVPPVVADLSEGHVDIGELGEGLVMPSEHWHREGEQALLPVAEDMGFQPAEAGEGSVPVG